jgi:alpha-galactosidase
VIVVMSLAFAVSAHAAPYMGVDTWYGYGLSVNEQAVVNLTNATVDRGLEAAGYRDVWIDAGWWKPADGPGTPGARNADGSIQLDPSLWPHGMRWLTDYIHAKGLLAGIYTDAGPVGCGNGGSWSHYQQDSDTFAAWGFDAVKVDYCGGGRTGMTPEQNFSAFSAALRASGRAMLLNVCNAVHPNGPGDWLTAWQFAPPISNAWRTGPDIGWPGVVSWSNVLRNLDLDASHPQAQSPGHYNDPDYIVPGESKTLGESRAQVTMWAMESAPMMISADLEHLPSQLVALTTNQSVIAVDRTDAQARQVGHSGIWTKPAPKGGLYVALLNRQTTARKMTARSLHQGRHPVVSNLWTRRASTSAQANVTVTVPGNSAALLQVTSH